MNNRKQLKNGNIPLHLQAQQHLINLTREGAFPPGSRLPSKADLLTIMEKKGQPQGKTIAVSWAYASSYSKPMSVPQSLILLMTRYGINVRLVHPPEFNLVLDGPQSVVFDEAENRLHVNKAVMALAMS